MAHDSPSDEPTAESPTSFVEPILRPRSDADKYTVFPIKDQGLWKAYKRAVASYWTPEEIDFGEDRRDFDKLNPDQQHFILNVLAFFAASDGIVNENLVTNFHDEVQLSEAQCFYAFQIAIEAVHAEVYSQLIDVCVSDSERKQGLFRAVETMPIIREKAQWALRWTDRGVAPFPARLVAFAVVEGIFFSSSFCAVFYLRKQGIMPGLGLSNELISRDEGMHCDFACELYKRLERPLGAGSVLEIVKEAVEIEERFAKDALPVSLLGMNCEMMGQYVRCCGNRLLVALGQEPFWQDAANPFPWMELISLSGKTNFFEKRVGEYQGKSGAGAAARGEETGQVFDIDAEF